MGWRYQTSRMELKKRHVIGIILLLAISFVVADTLFFSDANHQGHNILNVSDIGATTNEIKNVYVATDSRIYFGDGQESSIYYNGTHLVIS